MLLDSCPWALHSDTIAKGILLKSHRARFITDFNNVSPHHIFRKTSEF